MRPYWFGLLIILLTGSVTIHLGRAGPSEPTPAPPQKTVQPIFIPPNSNLTTELQLTREDLLPLVAQILSHFGIQQAGGRVIPGEELKGILSALEALWLVEYEITQRGVTVSDALKIQQAFMEQQGWRRIFWNRTSRGNREALLMVDPPRNGLFFVQARESSKALKVLVVRTKGMIDASTAVGILMTFLVKPEVIPPTIASPPPSEKKEPPPSEKPSTSAGEAPEEGEKK
ncbi:MAG: hypothetical protein NZ959_07255 [Armatimonadetes bacterium]|nr:hypothetical protein [Armatimonadota bacterium]MDW8122304.1 hypothetical protein [Armatimonadota bacterium]